MHCVALKSPVPKAQGGEGQWEEDMRKRENNEWRGEGREEREREREREREYRKKDRRKEVKEE